MDNFFTIRNIKDIEIIEQIPLDDRIVYKNTLDLLEHGTSLNPSGPAISFIKNGEDYEDPSVVTHQQLIRIIRQTANMFNDLGIGPKDVVTYLLPSIPHVHYVLWAAEATGIANPINPFLQPDTIRDLCLAANTKIIVAMGNDDTWDKVNAIRKEIPSLEYVIRIMGPSNEAEGIYNFNELVEKYPSDDLSFDRNIHPEDIASIYHTGGTTGRPKLARRSHFNEVALAWNIMVVSGLQKAYTVLSGLPLFHCNGTCVTGLLPFFVGGHVVILSDIGYRNPSIMNNFFKIVARFRPYFFSCVPTVLSTLLNIPVGDADLSSLKYVACGAAPLSIELFNRFEKHTGVKILEGYGLTETTCVSALNPKDGDRKIGSIGVRLPYQKIKISIIDENNGKFIREAGINEIGVVSIKGPCTFKGYIEPNPSEDIWLEDGWFNTGDLGRLDEDGFIFLTGRKKDLIIRGGHNIDPALIEEPLHRLPQIKHVAAVGRPDPYAGEVPIAYVELIKGADISAKEILNWAKEKIGERAAVPKEVIILDNMPLTAVGKIYKPALRWDAIKRVYGKELKHLGNLVSEIKIDVKNDKIYGTKVAICLRTASDHEKVRKTVQEILSNYSVHYICQIESLDETFSNVDALVKKNRDEV